MGILTLAARAAHDAVLAAGTPKSRTCYKELPLGETDSARLVSVIHGARHRSYFPRRQEQLQQNPCQIVRTKPIAEKTFPQSAVLQF